MMALRLRTVSPLSRSLVRSSALSTMSENPAADLASIKDRGPIGFIGLGNMGAFMAQNLLRKTSQKMLVYDLNPSAVALLKAAGASVATDLAQMQSCATIITMLPSSPHVASTVDALLAAGWGSSKSAAAEATNLLIDSSTIDPLVSRSLSSRIRSLPPGKFGVSSMVDAPVSGGVNGAKNGTLTFMVGGSQSALDLARPYLKQMGGAVVHCGENGAGESTKLCNNLAMAIEMVGVSEAINLGEKLGLDPKVLVKVMNTSTSRCWSSDTYNPYPGITPATPAANNYEGGCGSSLTSTSRA